MRYPDYIEAPFHFPPFFNVQIAGQPKRLQDLEGALRAQLLGQLASTGIRPGDTVAIGVGSRGIDRLAEIVGIICRCVIEIGAKPYIVPAMGSHGGATAEGQKALLASLGITEESCAAPIQSTMDTVQLGTLHGEVPVYYSKDAFQMDHALCINRIKPHTKFKAPLESGLVKMLCVGMGKHDGALAYHRFSLKYGFYELMETLGNILIKKSNVRLGIGIIENAQDEVMVTEVLPAKAFLTKEPGLLQLAKEHFPSLPLRQVDVLVVGNIGKEISGAGMDPNVTGRAFDLKESDFRPIMDATRVAILRLSGRSDGNALGLGNADFITETLFQTMDYEKTVINGLTSTSLHKAFIPIRMPTEEKAIQACFTTLGPVLPKTVRAVIIKDTLHVADFWASAALRAELEKLPGARLSEAVGLQFDANGTLVHPVLQPSSSLRSD